MMGGVVRIKSSWIGMTKALTSRVESVTDAVQSDRNDLNAENCRALDFFEMSPFSGPGKHRDLSVTSRGVQISSGYNYGKNRELHPVWMNILCVDRSGVL